MELPHFLQKIINKSSFLQFIQEVVEIYFDRRLGRGAAAFAYYLMLSFFPLLICLFSILGKTHIETGSLLTGLTGLLPAQVIETLTGFIQYVDTNFSRAMFWAGLALMLTTASGAFSTLMTTMGDLYGRKRYYGLLHTIMSFIYSLIYLVVIYGSVVMIATGGWFIQLLDDWFHVGDLLANWKWLRFIVLMLIIMMFLTILYRSATPHHKPALPILPGAAVATVLAVIVSIGFSFMIGFSVKYALVYGSLASLIILMLWLHLMGSIILIGGTINLVYWENHSSPIP